MVFMQFFSNVMDSTASEGSAAHDGAIGVHMHIVFWVKLRLHIVRRRLEEHVRVVPSY